MPPPIRLLIAEDDNQDFAFIQHALEESRFSPEVHRVHDGVEAIDYLTGKGQYANRTVHRFPDVVLLDLKMPRMNGFELLEWLEQNPQHRVIPTIVMSSSATPSDIERAYQHGAHSYFVKPLRYEQFVEVFRTFAAYWGLAITPGSLKRQG